MKFLRLIKISRPFFYIAPIIVFLIGLKLAGDIILTPLIILELIFFTFPYCLFLFGINDVFDYESDKLNPRKGSFLGGARLKKKELKTVYVLSFFAALPLLITSFFSMNFVHIFLCFLVLILSYFYSASPIRFKELPIIDSLSNAVIIFFVLAMAFVLNKSILLIPFKIYVFLLFILGLHAMGAVADRKYDKIVKHRTIATKFGQIFTTVFAIFCSLLAFLVGKFGIETSTIILLSVLFYIIALVRPQKAKLMFYLTCATVLIGFAVWLL
ncbi:MAG: UbiA family prenyltransferase [Nanoarchaeota archaeon]|nr:UbiA family prenyltransferase [Nanoarchaeota archaeon]